MIIREKIDDILDTAITTTNSGKVISKTDQILNEFRKEVDKLTVIGDEEIGKAVWGEWNAEHLRVAQAQLDNIKKRLKELLGGK